MTILINEVEKVVEINRQEARDTFQIVQKKLVQGKYTLFIGHDSWGVVKKIKHGFAFTSA
jgi:hypothetical protein